MATKLENAEGNMINTELNPPLTGGNADMERATQFSGRIIQLDMESAHGLQQGFIEHNIKEYTSYANGQMDKPPRWMGPRFGEAKKNIPDFSRAKGRTIAAAYAHDYNQLNAARTADQDGSFVKVTHKDGRTEQGIIDEVDGQVRREGQWISRDKEGNIRQIANFLDGKADGPAFGYDESGRLRESGLYKDGQPVKKHNSYNVEGQRVHEAEYEDGQLKGERSIDPDEQAAKREARKVQQSAVKAIGMRR